MNNSIAEVTNGNLTSSWSYNSSTEQIEIEAYNSNSGLASLTITEMKIWFNDCGNIDVNSTPPNKVYNINKRVPPRSDKRIYKSAIINYDGPMCSLISHKMDKVRTIDTKPKKEKSWFKWQYIFLIPLAFVLFGWVIDQFEGSKTNKKSKRLRPKQYSDYTTNTENFIEDVWEGRKPLGESFWLYFIVANFIISFGSAFLLEYFDSKFFLIPLIASNVWAGVGTWNSSDNYQKEKIKQKQGYGWAYTAKVFIVLNFLALAGNVIDIFNT